MQIPRKHSEGVVALLEQALALAREGRAEGVAILMAEHVFGLEAASIPVWVQYGATSRLDEAMEHHLRGLADRIGIARLNDAIPERPTGPANLACYNAATATFSSDFANWLIEREMDRVFARAPAPLQVGFWWGRNGKASLNNAFRRQMFEKVVRPMLDFVGAVESQEAAELGRVREIYCSRDICDRVRRGESIPRMKAPRAAVERMAPYRGAVTITLRESEDYEHRNSNVEAWLKFAADLQARGERVIFVRDTAKAYEPVFEGFEDCHLASTDLHLRCALYQQASLNFFTSNGPIMLAIYGHANYRAFLNLQPDGHPYYADTPEFWRERVGVQPGGQFPWAHTDQRIVWAADSYEAICAEWERRDQRSAA